MRLIEQMTSTFEYFSDRPALADRRHIPKSNRDRDRLGSDLLSQYETLTYAELWRRVEASAAQLCNEGSGTTGLHSGDRLAILGHPGIDFISLDLACNYVGLTTVPLQTSGSEAQDLAILDESAPRLLAVSIHLLDRVSVIISRVRSIERLLVLDYRGGDEGHRSAIETLILEADVVPELLDLDAEPSYGSREIADEHLAMLLYTSGSTGAPKGAMYSARLVGQMWGGSGWSEFFAERDAVASFHYMPMSHVAGHSSVRGTLARGGVTYLASAADLSNFFDDLALARPTELSLVPRVCELLHQEYRRRVGFFRDGQGGDASSEVLEEMRTSVLGGRVDWASCTSAPVSAEIKEFIERLLGVELHELYGTTEIGGVLADGRFLSPPVVDYRLEDVPELGYFQSDRPAARGELLVKSTSTVSGYFNRPELDSMVFTDDGYYRTGDIAAVDRDGLVRIVDRKNAIIKLAQGEFVGLPSLEAAFVAGSSLLRQIFLYGRSDQSVILAVVVPSDGALELLAGQSRVAATRLFLDELRKVAARERLNSYEVPAAVLVETEPFSETNGLLSDHRKPVRPRLQAKYRQRLDAIYDEISVARESLLAKLVAGGAEDTTASTVRIAAALTLQADPDTIDMKSRFRSLGGDSLTAVYLSRLLNQIYGFPVPVDVLVSESRTLDDLARHIDAKKAQSEWLVTFDEIHGATAERLMATDLTLSNFRSPDVGVGPAGDGRGDVQEVLITGASGFLGRFLCLEMLRRFGGTAHRVICLVRANSDATAATRLRDAFSSSPELLVEFDSLSGNLDVVAGDLAEPQLGLSDSTWERLTRSVTRVIHAAAMVNHALEYRELFAPNVAGTAEVLRLAVTGPVKPVAFLSSIATALLPQNSGPLDESVDIREALPEISNTNDIVDGYAATKWASEVLLRDAHDRYGLPVVVFRCSMILAHSSARGQINIPDTYTRLLFSLLRTGTAPATFYVSDGDSAHYDGLPVDVVGQIIATLLQCESPDYRTFHLVNPFDDGVSLDRIVRWIDEFGGGFTTVDTYDEWFERARTALGMLDDDDRRASLLPLIDGFRTPEISFRGSSIDSSHLCAALDALGAAGLIRPLDRQFVLKTVRDIEYVFGIELLASGSEGSGNQSAPTLK